MTLSAEAATNVVVQPDWTRPPRDAVDAIARFPVALIGDAQNRMGIMESAIRLLTPGLTLAGSVLPIQVTEGDNLAIHRALEHARGGDVLVVNGLGMTSRAVFGDLLAERCLAKGVAGVIVDGVVRDVERITTLGLAVFARGVSPAGPWKHGPGRVGWPVACGHVVCSAGDVAVGDSDGVAIVSAADLTSVLERARARDDIEVAKRATIRRPSRST
jgi:regulator of RNase E activity RraA